MSLEISKELLNQIDPALLNQKKRFTAEEKENLINLLDYLNCDEKTIKDYKQHLPHFIEFIKYEGFSRTLLQDYRNFLKDISHYSASTKQKYFIPAKHLLKILFREFNYFPEDITLDIFGKSIKGFKDNRIHRRFGYTSEEVSKVKEYIDNLNQETKETKRLKLAFYLFSHLGLRASEVVNISIEDIDFRNSLLKIKSKGKDYKEEMLMTPKVKEILADYLASLNIKSGYIFYSFSNNKTSKNKEKKLTTLALRLLFNKILAELGIEGKAPLHSFRHNFTTRLIENNIPLTTIQHFTRHKSLATISYYADSFNHSLEAKKINEKVFNF